MTGWTIKLRENAIDCLYHNQVVFKGLKLEGIFQGSNIRFSFEPYGDPYSISTKSGKWYVHIPVSYTHLTLPTTERV